MEMKSFITFLKSPKKDWRHWALLILTIALLGRCAEGPERTGTSVTDTPVDATQTDSATATQRPTRGPSATPPLPTTIRDANDPLASRLESIVNYALRGPTNYGKRRLVEIVPQFGSTPEETGHRLLRIRADKNLTNKLTVAGMLVDAVEVFESISKNDILSEIDSVTILFSLPMMDKYGNVDDMYINRIQLTADTMRRINWESMNNGGHRRLVDAADTYVLNPLLR
jgi:hypothetical protein